MKSRAFSRFIISYIVVLVIPMILISFFIYMRFVNILKEDVMNSTSGMLTQVRDVMDGHLDDLNNISAQINSNERIRPILTADDITQVELYPTVSNALKEINNYKVTNNIIYDIMIFFKDKGIIVSDSSKFTYDSFLNRYYTWQNTEGEEFMHQVESTMEPRIIGSQNVYVNSRNTSLITYMRPIPINSYNPGSTLVITIEDSFVQQMVKKVLGDYSGEVYMMDASNNVISKANVGDYAVAPEIVNGFIASMAKRDSLVYNSEQGSFIMSYVKSEKTGWKYVAVMPSAQILKRVEYVKITSIEIILAAFLIGLGFAFYFSKGNYSNLKRITDSILSYRRSGVQGYKNEWEFINDSVISYISENDSLQRRLEEQVPVMKNNFLMRLMKGSFTDCSQLDAMAVFLNIKLDYGAYAVILLNIGSYRGIRYSNLEPTQQEVLRVTMSNTVEKYCSQVGTGYAVDMGMENITALVALKDGGCSNYSEILKHMGDNIRVFAEENLGIMVTVGISDACSHILDVRNAYRQANTAIDYRMIRGENMVILYSEINDRIDNRYYYSFSKEKEILNSLRAGDFNSIKAILQSVIQLIKNEPVSLDVVKCVYFEIVNTALKSLNELGISNVAVEYHLPSLVHIQTIDEVLNEVCKFYSKVCEQIQHNKYSKNIDRIEKVMQYVQSVYTDKLLSVESVASEFSVSPSYMSRFFKDQTGYCFTDYLHGIRLNKAKELLEASEKNISEIADEVGYNSMHNFIRVFKRYEGVTPTEYRNSRKVGVGEAAYRP